MTAEEFDGFVKLFFGKCYDLLTKKGDVYAGRSDRFSNFKNLSMQLGVGKYIVWAVYFQKHCNAILTWIRNEYQDVESIEQRIIDVINFLFLLAGMIEEDKQSQNQKGGVYDC